MSAEIKGEIASEVSTGPTSGTGERVSKDSDWTVIKVPAGHVINKGKTNVDVISARGSEHTYEIDYADYVEIIPGTAIMMPTTIKVRTHARSDHGLGGGGGGMKVKVTFFYVKYN